DSLAKTAGGRQLSGGAVLPRPRLRGDEGEEARAAPAARAHHALQGEGHLPRLGAIAPRGEQRTRREGPPEDPRRQTAVADPARARRGAWARGRRRRVSPPVRGVLVRRGRGNSLPDRLRCASK